VFKTQDQIDKSDRAAFNTRIIFSYLTEKDRIKTRLLGRLEKTKVPEIKDVIENRREHKKIVKEILKHFTSIELHDLKTRQIGQKKRRLALGVGEQLIHIGISD